MAKNDNLKDFLTDVANAIREKKGTTDLINPQDFSAEIASIKSGGGAVAVSAKAVNFRDYDGTILHSYTKDEFLALSELPPLPTREGLICQEWNYNFADAVEYVSEYGMLEVGATYITDDGKTRLYITIAAEGRMDVPLYFEQSVANGVTIDWGDGSATETLSGTGKVNTTHHYNAIGDYVISLEVADGCTLGFGHAASAYCIMGETDNDGKVYCNLLKKAFIGNNAQINEYGLQYCASLIGVTIPKKMSIFGRAFQYCYSLGHITIPNNVSMSTYALRACYGLRTMSLGANLQSIYPYVFQNCYSLNAVVLPKAIAEISAYSFSGCRTLASVKFPKTILYLQDQAFANCYGMAYYDFSSASAIPTLSYTTTFTNIPSDCKIIVPDALYDEWIAATNWSTYASQTIKKSEWDALNA